MTESLRVVEVFLPSDDGPVAGQAWATVQHKAHPDLMFVLGFAGADLFSIEVRPFSDEGARWPFDPRNRPAHGVDLTAQFLRALPLGQAIAAARAAISAKAVGAIETFEAVNAALHQPVEPGASVVRLAEGIHQSKRPGRRGRPDVELARLAARYVELLATGPGVPRLAKERLFTEAYVRALLGRARTRGLLTKAPPGRPGGALTDKALALLQDHERMMTDGQHHEAP